MTEERIQQIVEELKLKISDNYNLKYAEDETLEKHIEELLNDYLQREYISIGQRLEIVQQVFNSIRENDLLDMLLEDDSISEIIINGSEKIFIKKNGEIHRLEINFEDERNLENRVQKLIGQCSREANQINPIVKTCLPDGTRVTIVLPPLAMKGIIVAIKKVSKTSMTIGRLLENGSITSDTAYMLDKLVKSKRNILIAGEKGSGKTAFLNAISNLIPKDELVVAIENMTELQVTEQENFISLETCNDGEFFSRNVKIKDLIRASIELNADRIVVGEIQNGAVMEVMQVMNTGQARVFTTISATSTKEVFNRLEFMALQEIEGLPLNVVQRQIASAADIVIFLSKFSDESSNVLEICEVSGYKNGEIQLNMLHRFQEEEKMRLSDEGIN